MTYKQWLILKRMRDAQKQSGHWPEEIDALDTAVKELEFVAVKEAEPKPSGSWRKPDMPMASI